MDTQLSQLVTAAVRQAQQSPDLTQRDLLRLQRRFAKSDPSDGQPFYTKSQIRHALAHSHVYKQADAQTQARLQTWLRVKPIRTQSGIASVTVLTKPWPCPGQCLFCPADIRMPKSYLANEPGAQRAELNYFDPYLQVTNRLETLAQMGHPLDKIEIIILGGTWDSYPLSYQRWFITQIFAALNEFSTRQQRSRHWLEFYQQLEQELSTQEIVLTNRPVCNQERLQIWQEKLANGQISYNQLVQDLYLSSEWEQRLATVQQASWQELELAQQHNQESRHRNVGLVIETRPDLVTPANVMKWRRLGCTKIQLGVQTVDDHLLQQNRRHMTSTQIATSFALLRLYGFKIHAHFMANLYGSNVDTDITDFATLVSDERFIPDEIKLYPCSLLRSAPLYDYFQQGQWQPYTQDQLLTVMTANMQATPPYIRISRMIRDFSAHDIVAGNKKTNFRQLVDEKLLQQAIAVQEIRTREIKGEPLSGRLTLSVIPYQTSVSSEYFLQLVTSQNKIAAFLRLSIPDKDKVKRCLPRWQDQWDLLTPPAAMIREVHVYGQVSHLGQTGVSQHRGLGARLIRHALKVAKAHHCQKIRVISAVGTRGYYAKFGFQTDGYYQSKSLI